MRMQAKVPAPQAAAPTHSFTRTHSRLLQRTCACAGSAGPDDQCAEKDTRRRTAASMEQAIAPPIVEEVLRSPGQPLDAQSRAFFEPRFGHDLSRVRLHADTRAAESTRAVNAIAYTVGSNVVFGTGRYQPATQAGRELLAHELTHVIQQPEASGNLANLRVGGVNSVAERKADEVANSVAANRPLAQPKFLTAQLVQRQTDPNPPAPSPPRGVEKWQDLERADYFTLYQLALQGVSGRSDLKTAQDKAKMAENIADHCMLILHRHGRDVACTRAAVTDNASKIKLEVVLPGLKSSWGESFKSALQTTSGIEKLPPSVPGMRADEIADQAVLAAGQLDEDLWRKYMACKQPR
jgi:hypothetical protein